MSKCSLLYEVSPRSPVAVANMVGDSITAAMKVNPSRVVFTGHSLVHNSQPLHGFFAFSTVNNLQVCMPILCEAANCVCTCSLR